MQHQVIAAVTEGLAGQAGLTALFLSGSFGEGQADAYSDVDFLAVAAPEHRTAIADRWAKVVGTLDPVVFQQRFGPTVELVNLVTESWLRADLSQGDEGRLKAQGARGLKPLIDPQDLHTTLDEAPVWHPQPLPRIAEEFLRVLGLLQVAMGRKDYVNAITGLFHLRRQLTTLLIRQSNDGPTGGALRLNRLLTAEQMALLADLHIPAPEPGAVIDGYYRFAAAFLPLAREMAGAEFPHRFEAATLTCLAERVDPIFARLKGRAPSD
ncbi:nucleotidyltransferase domain-containing protein [Halovulum sp. GXIMD14793]